MHPARYTAAVMIFALLAGNGASEPTPAKSKLHPSLEKDVLLAIDVGLRWLEQHQQKDGHWSLGQYPAITGLVTQAYLNAPARRPMEVKPHVARALEYIASCVREDGGIYRDVPHVKGGGLSNYNTAICMSALAASGDVKYDPIVRNARDFLARHQHKGADVYYGGFGYDASLGRAYADMANTSTTLEAMRFTRFVVDNSCPPPIRQIRNRPKAENEIKHEDVDWQAALRFLGECQNLPSGRAGRAVSPRAQDKGGLFYEPNSGKAGGEKDAGGRPIWYSYGTATYGGLLCMLLADLDRNDPRVRGAVGWVRRNWSVTEHPGLGRQGLYFYYYTIAKALRAYGEEELKLADGRTVRWRGELARQICALQKKNAVTGLGYWVNENGRWMENDPVLVTAYSVLALEMTLSDTAP